MRLVLSPMTRDLYEIIESMPEPELEDDLPVAVKKRRLRASIRMKRRNPSFSVTARAERSEWMKSLHAEPEFAQEHRERGRIHMKRMNRDPKFNARRLENLRATMNSDAFRERCRAAALKRWAKARGE